MMKSIQVIPLSGGPRARGQAHGEILRQAIHEVYGLWRENIAADMRMDPGEFLAQFLAETDFLPAIRRWAPDLLEEVQGIAEGAGLPFEHVLARQLSDEEPWFRIEKKIERGDLPQKANAEHCSALGIGAPNNVRAQNYVRAQNGLPNIIAQNMDVATYNHSYQVLLHIHHPADDLQALVFTTAGKISLAGMNNQGLAICCNTVMQLDHSRTGMAEDFLVRSVLARRTLAEAVAFLNEIEHASGQNYILGSPDGIIDLECSARQVCRFEPFPLAGRVFHTNHPVVNPDQGIYQGWMAQLSAKERAALEARSTSEKRFASLAQSLGNLEQPLSLEAIKAILSSHDGPVCVDGEGTNITLGCLVMELSASPRLHLSPGPPCKTPFETICFD